MKKLLTNMFYFVLFSIIGLVGGIVVVGLLGLIYDLGGWLPVAGGILLIIGTGIAAFTDDY